MWDSLITSRYEGENTDCKFSAMALATGNSPGVEFVAELIRALNVIVRFEEMLLLSEMFVSARIMTRGVFPGFLLLETQSSCDVCVCV